MQVGELTVSIKVESDSLDALQQIVDEREALRAALVEVLDCIKCGTPKLARTTIEKALGALKELPSIDLAAENAGAEWSQDPPPVEAHSCTYADCLCPGPP